MNAIEQQILDAGKELDRKGNLNKVSSLVKKGDKSEAEQMIADVALKSMRDKMQDINPEFIGGQLLEISPEGDRGAMVFGVKFGRKLVQVPALFVNGRIKGTEMMNLPEEDLFVPFDKQWADIVSSSHLADLGVSINNAPVGKPSVDLRPPFALSPMSVGPSNSNTKYASMPMSFLPDEKHMHRDGVSLKKFLKSASPRAKIAFLNQIRDDEFTRYVVMYQHDPDEIVKLAKSTKDIQPLEKNDNEKVVKIFENITDEDAIELSPDDKNKLVDGAVVVKDKRPEDKVYKIKATRSELSLHSIPGTGVADVVWPYKIKDAFIFKKRYDKHYDIYDPKTKEIYEVKSGGALITNFRSNAIPDYIYKPDNVPLTWKDRIKVIDQDTHREIGTISSLYDEGMKRDRIVSDDSVTLRSVRSDGTYTDSKVFSDSLFPKGNRFARNVLLLPFKDCIYADDTPAYVGEREIEDVPYMPLLNMQEYKIIDSTADITKEPWMEGVKVVVDSDDFTYPNKKAAFKALITEHDLREIDARRILEVPDVYFLEKRADVLNVNTTSQTETQVPGENPVGTSNDYTGQLKEFFDASVIASLLKTPDAADLVDEYLHSLVLTLDKIARLLLLIYWKPEDFSDRYGKNAVSTLEGMLKNIFESLGESIAILYQKKFS